MEAPLSPSELSDLLWAQVDRVAPHLLPNGKKEGHEWVAGNVNGDKGNSLKVNLSGKKKWADFAEGDGGDMLDLWMACRGINLHQAMQEAKAFLGIKDDDHHFDAKREKKFSRPDRKKIARYVTRTESHLEYLQSRGISPEVVKRYEVVSGKVWNGELELDALVIPYKRDGELLQVKRISTERPDGKKVIMAEGDCEPCLFGWQALDAGVRAVVLCEGEIDCMSYAQYGISALSETVLSLLPSCRQSSPLALLTAGESLKKLRLISPKRYRKRCALLLTLLSRKCNWKTSSQLPHLKLSLPIALARPAEF